MEHYKNISPYFFGGIKRNPVYNIPISSRFFFKKLITKLKMNDNFRKFHNSLIWSFFYFQIHEILKRLSKYMKKCLTFSSTHELLFCIFFFSLVMSYEIVRQDVEMYST